jgi:hypothetical protein
VAGCLIELLVKCWGPRLAVNWWACYSTHLNVHAKAQSSVAVMTILRESTRDAAYACSVFADLISSCTYSLLPQSSCGVNRSAMQRIRPGTSVVHTEYWCHGAARTFRWQGADLTVDAPQLAAAARLRP